LTQIADQLPEPTIDFLPYDFDFLKHRKWHLLAESMIECDLRELTNTVNHWHDSLKRWHAWNIVISKHNEDDAWVLRREFLEALAHECLLRPSSVRDMLTAVATSALHQVRLTLEHGYPDMLEGDPATPNGRGKHLTRRKKESRLASIASVWAEAKPFLEAIRKLDDSAYRSQTLDYRNLNSHAIGPRLGIGHTRTVTRLVVQATKLTEIGEGRFKEVAIPNKMTVSYGFGGTPPLNLEEARRINVQQFSSARSCYLLYRKLLEKVANDIPRANGDA
jgi:hypothetical protein